MAVEWTEQNVDILRRQWAAGLSASKIASSIEGASRSAIIGKAHRLKLADRLATQSQGFAAKSQSCATEPRQARSRRGVAVVAMLQDQVEMPKMKAEVIEAFPPVDYLKTGPNDCLALLDERGSDGLLMCCGAPKVHGSSYCLKHDRLFTPGRYNR